MSESALWSRLIRTVVWLVLMALVMGWLGRSRKHPAERTADAVILRYPRSIFIIGLAVGGLFSAAAIGALRLPQGSAALAAGIFFGFSMLGWPLVFAYAAERHELGHEGIRFRTMFLRRGRIFWYEMAEIHYSAPMKWFTIVRRGGSGGLHLSAYLVGLPEFARLLLARCPEIRCDDATRRVLKETAGGNPPSAWM